jgi:hypothetical protein
MFWTRIRRLRGLFALGLMLLLSLAFGCGMDLETGYKYRPLDASTAQRKAYYANAFTPEKSAAESEKHSGAPAKAVGPEP